MAWKNVILICLAAAACISANKCKVDFVFMVDGSGSICNNNPNECQNWRTIRQFIAKIVNELDVSPDGSHVGMITFGSSANLIWSLDQFQNNASIMTEIGKLRYLDETTFTYEAFDMARQSIFGQSGDRVGVPNVAFLLTDGVPSNKSNPFVSGKTLALEAADKLKQQDVNLITIGVGTPEAIDPTLLKQLSSSPQEKDVNYFTSADFENLKDNLAKILDSACPATTTTTTTTTTITTTPAPTPGNCLLDLTFIVDRSGSICNNQAGVEGCENWESVKSFISAFVDKLPIDDGSVRVAMVVFGSSANIFWQLSGYSNKQTLKDAIQGIKFESESTNTSFALQLTRTHVYGSSDDRTGVSNLAIMLTDGVPTGGSVGRQKAIDQATQLKNSKVKIITIGVTRQIDQDLLKEMSSGGVQNKDYFLSPNFSDLNTITQNVLLGTCHVPDLGCDERDVVMVLDASGSINENNFNKAKEFLSTLAADMSIGASSRLGLMTFGDNVNLQFHLNKYDRLSDMQDAISATPYSRGSTNTAAALRYVGDNMFTSNNGDRSGADDLVIIFTDGGSDNHEATVTEALRLKARGIHILVVGIGNWLQKYELRSIASHPDSANIKYIDNYDNLGNHVDFFKLYNCKRDNPCLQSPCRNGGSCVSKPDGKYYCRCASPYGGQNCDYSCRKPKDVIFTLDASGSITRDNFKYIVEFAKAVTLELPVDTDTRIGFQTFSDNYKVYFNLRDYNDRSVLVNMMSIPYFMDGTTNTHLALQNMRDNMFTSNNGDQFSVPNIGVVVSDGRSNDPTQTWNAAKNLRGTGVEVIAIGVSPSADKEELAGIASKPFKNDGKTPNLKMVENFEDLQDIVRDTRDTICQAKNFCDPNPCNDGRCQEHMDGYICECPSDSTGNNCERRCEGEADVVLVVDNSGSIRRERFDEVKDYLISVVENLEVDTGKVHVGAVTFSDDAGVAFGLSGRGRQDIVYQIRNIKYNAGRTNIADALRTAREDVFGKSNDRSNAPNYIILFTDGSANIKSLETIPEAIKTRLAGIKIIVVGVGMDLDKIEMEGIASYPSDKNVITVERFRDIQTMEQPAIDAMCNSYNECNDVQCRNGGVCVDKLYNYDCTCSSDFTGQTCDRRCSVSTDVVFIVDLSGSADVKYDASIAFLRETIQGLPFPETRVSIITYADKSTTAFSLDRYTLKQSVLDSLSFYQDGGQTNTQEALSAARKELVENGRDGVYTRVVLLTDGGGNIDDQNTLPNAQDIKDYRNTFIDVVAIGDNVDGDVSRVASRSIITMVDESQAKSAADQVLDHLCSRN